jgi:FMN phosphatase YigB (HAD superfamily)/CTP:molybdopterin cytidylyltransferase MocA
MPKAVLLDLNGVIEDVSSFLEERNHLIVTTVGATIPDYIVREEAARLREDYDAIMSNTLPEFHLMFWDDLLRRLKLTVSENSLFYAYERFVEQYLHVSRVFPDAKRLLTNPIAHTTFGILTNANSLRARRYLRHHTLCKFVNAVVISHDTPYAKPCREVFLLAAQRLRRSPEDVIMVGDRVDNDIQGATEAGMTPILVDRSGTLSSERIGCRVISDLDSFSEVYRELAGKPNATSVVVTLPSREPKVVIVCGGAGSRLKGKTGDSQKCLVPVKGKPILLHTIDALMAAGLRDFDLLAGTSVSEIEIATAHYKKGNCVIRMLPICEPGTGRAMQAYWSTTKAERRDVIYSHGNIIVEPSVVQDFITKARNDNLSDIVFLSSPEWMARTHAALVPRDGVVFRINTDSDLKDRVGLCSVGMAFVRRRVPLDKGEIGETDMFEDIIESLRSKRYLRIGHYYSDTAWEHLGIPEDWERLVSQVS